MTRRFRRHASSANHGQVLVLTGLMMVILIGFAGLAIDISSAYLSDRWQRSVADASALAGGQDLQIPGSRAVPTSAEYARAEANAMRVLVSQMEASSTPTGSDCFTSVGCALPGTPYEVSVQTPSPSCVDCQPERAIQVTIRQPSFGLTFARIFGQTNWTVSSTSVAGIVQARQYGVVTLRPPRPRTNGTDANEANIFVTGGSKVRVNNADIGTNTNLVLSGVGSEVILQTGFAVDHYDAYQAWSSPPEGRQITSPIPDPEYSIPDRADDLTYPRWPTNADGEMDPVDCDLELDKVPAQYVLGSIPIRDMDIADVTCLLPGVYPSEVQGGIDEVVLLTPGVYFLDHGINMGNASALVGGYEGGQPGVALVFLECVPPNLSNNCPLKGNATDVLALNFGSAYQDPTGDRATAAEWNGGLVQTSGTTPVLMSIMVEPDVACLAPPFPTLEPDVARCTNHNATIILPGHANLWVAGIQYAPTDNATVTGGSGSAGILGQIISWTIRFTGGSNLNLEAVVSEENGVLRLDPACSPTVNVCNP